jgi:hypothetical protein
MAAHRLIWTVVVSLCATLGALGLAGAPASAATGFGQAGSFSSPGGLAEPTGLAVDDSAGLSRGSVYVTDAGHNTLDKFSAAGVLQSEVTVAGSPGLGQIAVDDYPGLDEGDVYVAGRESGVVYQFSPALVLEKEIKGLHEPIAVTVDEAGDLFVSEFAGGSEQGGKVLELNAAGEPIDASGTFDYANVVVEGLTGPQGLAVSASGEQLYLATWSGTFQDTLAGSRYTLTTTIDPTLSTGVVLAPFGEIFVDQGGEVAEHGSTGALLDQFGAGVLSGAASGVGIDAESKLVYVADQATSEIDRFESGLTPEVPVTVAASAVKSSTATLNGELTAGGGGTTGYYFEYRVGGSCEGGERTTAAAASSGAVQAEVTGLQPHLEYTFCLVATNKYGETVGSARSLKTVSVPPVIGGESVSSVGIGSATLSAMVNTANEPVTYYFEYGTTGAFESGTPEKTPEVSVEAGASPVSATARVVNLQAGTEYHFLLVAKNANGEPGQGSDFTFDTAPHGPEEGLPDGRVYEMVTPVANREAGADEQPPKPPDFVEATNLPFQASANGDAVAYESEPTTGGNGWDGEPFGNTQLATRLPGGEWSQKTMESNSTSYETDYQAFSEDLSLGIIGGCDQPTLAPTAPSPITSDGSAGYNVLYTHDDDVDGGSGFSPLFTTKPRNRVAVLGSGAAYFGTTSVPAINSEEGYQCSNALVYAGASHDFSHLLFEANDSLLEGEGNLEKELDSDVKKEMEEGRASNDLYVSVDDHLELVNILPEGTPAPNATFGAQGPRESEHGKKWPDFSHVISADGSRIFWTDLDTGIIYVREDGASTLPVSEGSAQFWTASSDGRYVFYTEEARLYRFDVESQTREELAITGQPNLYSWQPGTTSFIATLTAGDAQDWSEVMGLKTAEVASNGHSVVFMSARSLTGYANEGEREVYVYESEPDGLYCASCSQEDEPGSSGLLPVSLSNTYMYRWLSADGSRVFFDSGSALVPQDTDGDEDVYEWERDGAGSCERAQGCVYLLSGGTAGSVFIDASVSGNDVFFVTLAQLLPQDGNEVPDVYDARVGGQQVAHSKCSGTGCQGPPTAPPPFATPASVTFEGVGNFPAPGGTTKPAAIRSLTRAQKLTPALKACKAKRRQKARRVCEAQARKRYGARVTRNSSTTRKGR